MSSGKKEENVDNYLIVINREWGMGNGERGTGNGEQGTGSREQGTGNGERGMGNGEWVGTFGLARG